MRLRRIEAANFGALQGACLGELGDGLTVVLGPNESGKSTFTALTRHVLFGYPDARMKERGYSPRAGARDARLVFSEGESSWAIERVDGRNRGPVSVATLSGAERPGLLGELTGGVSEQTYRVVFGFGIDEMALIESGSTDEVVGRLYAGGSGLAVNPLDVRKDLDARAGALFAPRASKPRVNQLAAQLRDTRARIRDLENEASRFAEETARLAELAKRLAPLRSRRDELETRSRLLERDVAALKDALRAVGELSQQAAAIDAGIDELERDIARMSVDERVLAVAPELGALLDEASGFRQRLEAVRTAEADAASALARAEGTLAPADARGDVETRTAFESWAERLTRLAAESESAARSASAAEARAESTAEVAAAPAAARVRRPLAAIALALLALGVGVVAVAAGVLLKQPLAAVLGGLLVVAGAAGLAVALLRPGRGAMPHGLAADAARLEIEARSQRALALGAARAHDNARTEWRHWLTENRLDAFGEDPGAVRQLLDALKERDRLLAEARRHQAAAALERDAARAWAESLLGVVTRFEAVPGPIALEATLEVAARAKAALDSARESAAQRSAALREIEGARTERARIAERLDAARAVAATLCARHGIDPAEVPHALEVAAASAEQEASAVRDEYEALRSEHDNLDGRLAADARDDAMARARQELEGLRAQAQEESDRYLAAALSVRLLDLARERYERERQPLVVQTAARVFSAMTDGRYRDVRVPLDDSGVSVVASDGTVRTTSMLSRGTAEQLYLALRVGLIGSLGEQGRHLPVLMDDVIVNFDPERRSGAAAAVAELAAMRQVIFFTCHPDTARTLSEAVPGTVTIELGRCSLGAGA